MGLPFHELQSLAAQERDDRLILDAVLDDHPLSVPPDQVGRRPSQFLLVINSQLRKNTKMSSHSACTRRAARLSASEEHALAKKIKIGDLAAQEQLITANLALVLRAVRDYQRTGIPLEDLVQEGNLGLVRAARSFDPSDHTARFASYARFWIHSSLIRAVASNGSLIQVPERMHGLGLRYRRAIDELRNRMAIGSNSPSSGQPSLDEIAAHMGIPSRRLLRARLTQKGRTLCPILDELMPADDASPDQIVSNDENRALVHAALRQLSRFEAWVIRERYGLGEPPRGEGTFRASRRRTDRGQKAGRAPTSVIPDAEPVRTPRPYQSYYQRSYREIGNDCGLSAFHIRQVEKAAVEKLGPLLAPHRSSLNFHGTNRG